jgi:hypothetical protein
VIFNYWMNQTNGMPPDYSKMGREELLGVLEERDRLIRHIRKGTRDHWESRLLGHFDDCFKWDQAAGIPTLFVAPTVYDSSSSPMDVILYAGPRARKLMGFDGFFDRDYLDLFRVDPAQKDAWRTHFANRNAQTAEVPVLSSGNETHDGTNGRLSVLKWPIYYGDTHDGTAVHVFDTPGKADYFLHCLTEEGYVTGHFIKAGRALQRRRIEELRAQKSSLATRAIIERVGRLRPTAMSELGRLLEQIGPADLRLRDRQGIGVAK